MSAVCGLIIEDTTQRRGIPMWRCLRQAYLRPIESPADPVEHTVEQYSAAIP
jgi:hypothetical protein